LAERLHYDLQDRGQNLDERENLIRKNLEGVTARIDQAACSAGRNPQEVQIVVVTKAQPLEVVRSVLRAGVRLIGENYPDETEPKILALQNEFEAEWHMIGHLQSRKARIVVELFDCIESLDRLDLALKLERQLTEKGKVLPALLEFNVGGEESKSGWNGADEQRWDSLLPEMEQILALPHLYVQGLMTMPPLFENPEQARPYFQRLARLRDFLAMKFPQVDFHHLSMGTSGDFEVAVQEGATLVRIGTAIVGPRLPKSV
jgi:pyridoxal phosphate enzyme (YggS family)